MTSDAPEAPRPRLHYPGPALSAFPHKDTWRARDAALMRQLMTAHLASPLGDAQLVSIDRALATRRGQSLSSYDVQSAHVRIQALKQEIVTGWHDVQTPTVLLSDDAAQMLLAAAVTSPDTPLHPQEILSTSGVVFFVNKQDFSGLSFLAAGMDTAAIERAARIFQHLKVRAFSWVPTSAGGGEGLQGLKLDLYTDGPDQQHYDEVLFPSPPQYPFMPLAAYAHLGTLSTGFGHLGGTSEDYATIAPSVRTLIALVRAVSAIAESEQTQTATGQTESAKQKKIRTRQGKQSLRPVRLLSLRRPEHGTYELDAATGRKQRAHWVRGHWRNQWYASLGEHRTIWIDGFIKGDAKLGTLTAPKVYTA